MRVKRLVATALGTTLLLVTAAPAASAFPSARTTSPPTPLDRQALDGTLDAIHDAGMYGTYSSVREGGERWMGASGVADVDTGREVTPNMRHRVGSISKTFTAVAILQQVDRGRIDLDAPIARYLPELFRGADGQRGETITVRMLLSHTSGIGDYVLGAFPSLAQGSTASLDEERFRRIAPEELVRLGLMAPSTGEPGAGWSYSNTNYIVAGLLLEKVTGQEAGAYITRHVIDRAGLRHTTYPRTPYIKGPHSKMYESWYGVIDPPRDYSVYDMSWGGTAGAIVSTTDDLNRFYRKLLTGRLMSRASLAEMQKTVPAPGMEYGLGLYALDLPGCGRFWGHDGAVFGAGTISLSSPDADRQLSIGLNLMKYQRLNEDGTAFEPSPIDAAINTHIVEALCDAPPPPQQQQQQRSQSPSATAQSRTPERAALPDGLRGVDLTTGSRAVMP